jgi:transcriptional regulator with XRE-family HTH domain
MNPLIMHRERAGLTQKELAQRSGTYQERISDYEAGKRKIPPKQAVKLAKVLNCKASDLLPGRIEALIVAVIADGPPELKERVLGFAEFERARLEK